MINIVYRKYTTIKASSYRLNQFIFVGCYLVITSAVLYTISESIKLHTTAQTGLCNTVLWTANMGLTLILATVCLKTWRLYYIFKKQDVAKIKTVLIKDKFLAVIIGLLFLVDIFIGVIWSFNDPLKAKENTFLENTGVIAVEITCESKSTETWLVTTINEGIYHDVSVASYSRPQEEGKKCTIICGIPGFPSRPGYEAR